MTARILVVDDVEANVRLLEAKLTLEYYEVLTAGDGSSALQVANDERPDIILLDGDPLEGYWNWLKTAVVVKAGKVVVDKR